MKIGQQPVYPWWTTTFKIEKKLILYKKMFALYNKFTLCLSD